MQYHSSIRKNGIQSFAAKWMELEPNKPETEKINITCSLLCRS